MGGYCDIVECTYTCATWLYHSRMSFYLLVVDDNELRTYFLVCLFPQRLEEHVNVPDPLLPTTTVRVMFLDSC
jgi:hypothetical protein